MTDSGKEKAKMFTVILSSNLRPEKLEAALDYKNERSLGIMHSDRNKLEENTVAEDVGLSG